MRKGMSPFISTAFAVLFGIVLISAVMVTLGKVQTEGVDKTVRDQLTTLTREMGTELLNIYSGVKDYNKDVENNSVILVRETEVSLPNQIGSKNYNIQVEEPQDVLLAVVEFFIDGRQVNTTSTRPTARIVSQSDDVEISNKLYNIDIGLQGETKGGLTKIRGYTYNYNGTTRDKIVLGDDTIIVSITDFTVTEDSDCSTNKKVTMSGYNIYTSGVIPSTLNFKAIILETSEFNETSSSNPFSIDVCTSVDDQEEGTVLLNVWDANGNQGLVRKKFLG